jgi:lipoprotein-releasing system ATP-binding protein
MNDDLERLLNQSPRPRGEGADPRLRVGLSLSRGLPLDGGAGLDITSPPVAEPARPDRRGHPLAGPVLAFPQQQPQPPPQQSAAQATSLREPRPNDSGGHRLTATDVWKSYRKGAIEVPVLRGVNLAVRQGELLAVVGQSGSGKSTLLHLLGTLDASDQGEICFDGHRIDDLPPPGRDILRNRHFGMIFQFYHLLPELTTLENVLMPLMIAESTWGYFRRRQRHRAAALELLELVGLTHRLKHKPRELSGGEMQRAAIARALVAHPDLLLADEPTGNLDRDTGWEIIKILRGLNRQQNLTIVMVTHDQAIADQADRIVRLVNGRIE